MSLGPARTGEALRATAGELLRIWRSARAQVRPGVFPALADGAVEAFLPRAARALEAGGGAPEEIYAGIEAVVRVDPRDRDASAAELETEWTLLGEVLRATCAALDADDASRTALARAVNVARAGASDLSRGRGPRRVLVVGQLSGFEPPRKRRDEAQQR